MKDAYFKKRSQRLSKMFQMKFEMEIEKEITNAYNLGYEKAIQEIVKVAYRRKLTDEQIQALADYENLKEPKVKEALILFKIIHNLKEPD